MTYLSEQKLLKTIDERSQAALGNHDGKPAARDAEVITAQLLLQTLRGNPTGYEGQNINGLCPQVQPMGAAEFLQQWWGKK